MTTKGSFGAYLEYAQRGKEAGSGVTSRSVNLRFLEVLAEAPGTKLPMDVLAALGGLDLRFFQKALRELRAANFISISGPSLDEVVQLTDHRADAVRLIQY
jgi:hypothetical protein